MENLIITIFGIWFIVTMLIKAPIVVTIPKFWYEGITLGWLIILRRESYSDKLIAHEYIHFKQQKETLIIFGYLLYFSEFIIKSIYYRSFTVGYRNISFEREAHLLSGSPEYVFKRKPYVFRHFIIMDDILTLNKLSMPVNFDRAFLIGRGGVFKYTDEYFTIVKLIDRYKPHNKKFRVQAVLPGTSLYAIYGANTFVVLENTTLAG